MQRRIYSVARGTSREDKLRISVSLNKERNASYTLDFPTSHPFNYATELTYDDVIALQWMLHNEHLLRITKLILERLFTEEDSDALKEMFQDFFRNERPSVLPAYFESNF